MGGSPAPKFYFGFDGTEESFNASNPSDAKGFFNKTVIATKDGVFVEQVTIKNWLDKAKNAHIQVIKRGRWVWTLTTHHWKTKFKTTLKLEFR